MAQTTEERFREIRAKLTPLVIAGKDFGTSVDDIAAQLRAHFADEYNDFAVSGGGQILIDLLAYAISAMSFAIDVEASQGMPHTTRSLRSMSLIARSRGYKPKGAAAASVDVTVTLSGGPYSVDVTIPKGFQFSSSGGLTWEVAETVTIQAGETEATVTISQGVTIRKTFVASGALNQRYRWVVASGEYIATSSLSVRVGSESWTEYPYLPMEAVDGYEVDYIDPSVIFGNGVSGNIPAEGAQIEVVYFSTRGRAGMIGQDQISGPVRPLLSGRAAIPISVSQPNRANGGDDPEGIESIRANQSVVPRAAGAVVVESDFVSIARSFASSSGAVAQGGASSVRLVEGSPYIRGLVESIRAAASTNTEEVGSSLDEIGSDIDGATTTLEGASSLLDGVISGASSFSALIGGLKGAASAQQRELDAGAAASDASRESCGNVTELLVSASSILASLKASIGSPTVEQTELMSGMESAISNAQSAVEFAVGNVNVVQSKNATAAAYNAQIGRTADAIEEYVETVIGSPSSAAKRAVDTASGVVSGLQTIADRIRELVVDPREEIREGAALVMDYIGGALATDGTSNVVEVPVVTVDSDGFYAQPSSALVGGLQSKMDSMKEPQVTVRVVDGSYQIVSPTISVAYSLAPNFSQQEVAVAINTAIQSTLKGRGAGARLDESDLYEVVAGSNGVAGVIGATIRIEGPVEYLDDGSLQVLPGQFIGRGNLIIRRAE